MTTRRGCLFLFCLCLAAGAVSAAGPGTGAANFLKIPVGARPTALGGAFTAVADSPDALFHNPAGLSQLGTAEIGYSYNNYFTGISQHSAAAALPFSYGTWALGANYFQVAAFDSYDAQDNPAGKVSAYGLAAGLGYGGALPTGLAFLPSVRYGAAAKYVSESLDRVGADGGALDAGLLLLTGLDGLKLGAAADNLVSSRLDFDGRGRRPARRLKAGASYAIKGAPVSALLSAEFSFPEDGQGGFSAGLENTLYRSLFLRAGYTSHGDVSSGVSFGLGLNLPDRFGSGMRLDYSFGSTYDLGNIHKFGLSCRFGRLPGGALTEALVREELPRDAAAEYSARLDELYSADPAVSAAAAEALGSSACPKALDHFAAMLSSGRDDWKISALRGLSVCKEARAGELLAGALRDESPAVRRQAALTLGSRPGEENVRALQAALREEETEAVKSAIIEALGAAAPR